MSGKSIPSSIPVRELSGKIDPFLPCQGNIREICPYSLTSKNGATSMINIMFVLLAKRAFPTLQRVWTQNILRSLRSRGQVLPPFCMNKNIRQYHITYTM